MVVSAHGRHPGLHLLGAARQAGGQAFRSAGRDDEVVLDPYADAAQFRGYRQIVGLEVQSRLDGEDMTGLEHSRRVRLVSSAGAVMAVQPEHVARAAQGVAAVQVGRGSRSRPAVRPQPPGIEPLGDDAHRGVVEGAVRGAGPQRGDACRLGGEHQVVDAALDFGEMPAHRQGPGDVAGVEGVEFDTRVQQEQVSVPHRAVVAHPVQDAGVRAGRRDGVESQPVASESGTPVEGALDPALSPCMARGLLQPAHDVREAGDRAVDGFPQPGDLPLVLDESQLRQEGDEFCVGLRDRWHQCVDAAVLTAQYTRGNAPAEGLFQIVSCGDLDAERVRGLRERPAPADPELAVPAVAVELRAVRSVAARRPRSGEQGDRVAAAGRLEDQDAVGDRLRPLLGGEVHECGVRPERVVEVVAPHLQPAGGDDDPFAGKSLRHRRATLGRVGRSGRDRQLQIRRRPSSAELIGHCCRSFPLLAVRTACTTLICHRESLDVVVRCQWSRARDGPGRLRGGRLGGPRPSGVGAAAASAAQPGHPRLQLVGLPGQGDGEVLVAVLGHQDVVLDPYTDAAVLLGNGQVVGLEVDARFDGEHHAGFQGAVHVPPGRCLGAVVDVQAEHVTGPGKGPTALQSEFTGLVRRSRGPCCCRPESPATHRESGRKAPSGGVRCKPIARSVRDRCARCPPSPASCSRRVRCSPHDTDRSCDTCSRPSPWPSKPPAQHCRAVSLVYRDVRASLRHVAGKRLDNTFSPKGVNDQRAELVGSISR